MKPQRVDLHGVADLDELIQRIVQTRLGEARTTAEGLARRDQQSLHDFRIACKRLRYALERFTEIDPPLQKIAEQLALLQDTLGEAHDRDVLLAILPPTLPQTERRLRSEREVYVNQAIDHWHIAEQLMQALDSHAI